MVSRYHSALVQQLSGGGAGAGAFALDNAILAASPLGYWKGDEVTGDAIDYGSVGINGTYGGATRASVLGGDGRSYALYDGASSPTGIAVATDTAWGMKNSGRTMVALVKIDAAITTTKQIMVCGTAGSNPRWTVQIEYSADTTQYRYSSETQRISGLMSRNALVNSGLTVVQRDIWHLVTVAVPTITSHPVIKVNDVAPAVTNTTSGTPLESGGPLYWGYSDQTGQRFKGSLAHMAMFDGGLSDAVLTGIKAAAVADGWVLA